jgi:hypothetical protein
VAGGPCAQVLRVLYIMPIIPNYTSPKHDIFVHNPQVVQYELLFLHIFGWITKLTFFLFLIGFFSARPYYFEEFHFIVKFWLGVFLIYRFNNYRKYKVGFTEVDRHVAFSAGIYIVLISLIDYTTIYIDRIREILHPYTMPVVDYVNSLIGRTSDDPLIPADSNGDARHPHKARTHLSLVE